MGTGAGFFAGLLGGFAGRQLEQEDRTYKEKLAQNEQKRKIFSELIGNPNLSDEARSVALQGIVSMSREKPIAKGGKQQKNPSDDVFDQLLTLPPVSEAGRPEMQLPPMPSQTMTQGTLPGYPVGAATPTEANAIPITGTAPQGSLPTTLPGIPSKPGLFMSPQEQANREAGKVYTVGVAGAQAKADVETQTQKDEVESLVASGVPRNEATERVIMGKYPPRPQGLQAKVVEVPDPNDPNKTVRVWANYNPATGNYEPTQNLAPSSLASHSQFPTYYASVKAEHPEMSDADIVRQFNSEMASGKVVPTTTTTEVEESPGVIRRTAATRQRAGGGKGIPKQTSPLAPVPTTPGQIQSRPIVPRLDAATVTLGRTAKAIRPKMPRILQLAEELEREGKLGAVSGRWQDFLAGKVGEGDEKYAELRSLVKMFDTGTMRAHVGARGGQEMLKHFTSLLDASKMDLPTMRGSLRGMDTFLKGYEDAVFNPNGQTQATQAVAPPAHGGQVKTANDLKTMFNIK